MACNSALEGQECMGKLHKAVLILVPPPVVSLSHPLYSLIESIVRLINGKGKRKYLDYE